MRYAISQSGHRASPCYSGEVGACEVCQSKVIGHCGQIMPRYWSHDKQIECDPWSEGMTPWHKDWQDYLRDVKGARLEVVIERDGVKHRADAVLPDGTIIEIQQSHISVSDINEREDFYGERLIWIFDTVDAYVNKRFFLRNRKGKDWTFRWKQPRKSIAFTSRRTYLDLGDGAHFEIYKMYPDAPCRGLGHFDVSVDLMEYLALVGNPTSIPIRVQSPA